MNEFAQFQLICCEILLISHFCAIFFASWGDSSAAYPGNNGEKWAAAAQWHRTRAHFTKNSASANIMLEQIHFRYELFFVAI